MITDDEFSELNNNVKNMTIALNHFGVTLSEATNQFSIFSETIKSIKERHHPLIYWMYEIGILKD